MASYFFDTSALVKRYISEHGSAWVVSTCHRDAGHAILIGRVTSVELISALAKTKYSLADLESLISLNS